MPTARRIALPPGRAIQLAAFAAAFDSFLLPPLLAAIGRSHGTGTAEAAIAATAYFAGYGLMQLPWGLLSDRIGRGRAMRAGLLLSALAAIAATVAPDIWGVALARLLSGAAMAAVVPASIAWIGDHLPPEGRARAAADMNAGYAAGSAAGTLAAGLLAEFLDWRAALLLGTALSLLAAAALGALAGGRRGVARRAGLGHVLAQPAMRAVAVLAAVEGMVLFAGVAYLAPVLLAGGAGAAIAGAAAAAYGIGVAVVSVATRGLLPRLPPERAILLGGIGIALAWGLVALRPDPAGVLAAALLAAAGAAFLHTSLQVWATLAAPAARGAAVAVFAGALFAGAAIGVRLGQPLLAEGRIALLFGGAAALALGLALAAAALRRRHGAAPDGAAAASARG